VRVTARALQRLATVITPAVADMLLIGEKAHVSRRGPRRGRARVSQVHHARRRERGRVNVGPSKSQAAWQAGGLPLLHAKKHSLPHQLCQQESAVSQWQIGSH